MLAALSIATNALAKAEPRTDGKFAALETRLQKLEDTEAIRLLLERYIQLNESRDYAAYSELFAKAGEVNLRSVATNWNACPCRVCANGA